MSLIQYIVFYDVVDSSKFNMYLFLEERLKVFDSVKEAYEDIYDFVYRYNYLMNYVNKSQAYVIEKSEDDCESHFETNQFCVIGHTVNKEFRIVVKKVHTE